MPSAEFFLPWPDKKLSPNARLHWSKVAKVKRKAKTDAFYLVREAGIGRIEADRITVRCSFYPPDARRRDTDNMVASSKACLDGVSMAIGIDDSKWELVLNPRGPIMKNGMIKIELEWE